MIKPETTAMVYDIIAKLNAKDGQFVHGMLIEIQRLQAKVREQSERINEYSWRVNPDKSGGAFTDEEIYRSRNGGW